MKKAGKFALATIGGIVLLSGLVIVDAILRANAVIQAHEARLATDILALRTQRPLSPLPLPTGAPTEPRFGYDEGHTGQKAVWGALSQSVQFPMETTEDALESLAFCQEVLWETGLWLGPRRLPLENGFLERLREKLGRGLDGATQLHRAAVLLDQLYARRLSGPDFLAAEHALDRAEVLAVLEKPDATGMILRKPGWRELYSRRILVAKCLNQLEEQYRAVVAGRWPEPSDSLTKTALVDLPQNLRHEERRNQAQWTLTRAAVAAMLHHREHGRLPDELPPEFEAVRIEGRVLHYAGTSLDWTLPTD